MSHVARGTLGTSRASLRVLSEVWMMAEYESVVLASFVTQVRGVMFYGLQVHGARLAERVELARRPDDPYDNNYLDMRVVRSSLLFLPGHLAVEVILFCCVMLS